MLYNRWDLNAVLHDPTGGLLTAGLAAASLGTTVAGGLASAEGAKQSANAQSSMYNYQAAIADQNQQLAKQNSTYSLITGGDQQAQSGMATRAKVGQIRAAQGASGLNVNQGTMPLVPGSARTIGNLEQSAIVGNAAKAAYDNDISAWTYGNQAILDRAAASNTKAAGTLAYDASILGSAASVSNKWLQFNDSGNFAGIGGTNNWGSGGGGGGPGNLTIGG